jgi:predicted alpha/beta hydrolase family esterase
MDTILIVPGLNGSGAEHWQTWFERQLTGCIRVVQSDWNDAHLPRWSAKLRRELDRAPGRIWIVAHSFGCLATVHAVPDYRERIWGVMLVAPADPELFGLANNIPRRPLGVPAVVVASTNDSWMSFVSAADWADDLGAELINLGAAGHINVKAGYGPWPRGLAILKALQREAVRMPEGRAADELYHQLGEI